MKSHEWAWGDIGTRTVCGLTEGPALANAVNDLGDVDLVDRCKSCERMRGAIGASKKETGKE